MAQRRHYLKVAISEHQKRALAATQARTQAESVSDVVREAIDCFNERTTLEQSLNGALADLRETNEEALEALATKGAELLHAMAGQHAQIMNDIALTMNAIQELVGARPTKPPRKD